ncbi:MAG: glycogen synthase GlgA [Clostridiales bacterium]|jgi:starch synthase|nr:glycogen synthase GlgA [Clostridiales bacterium]
MSDTAVNAETAAMPAKSPKAEDLKVLIVASEVAPYAKSGGLGDVAGSLPRELCKLGVDCRVVFPKYEDIRDDWFKGMEYVDSIVVALGWRKQGASIHQIKAEVPTYVIENDFYFRRHGFYGYGDDFERFAFFSKASIEMLTKIDFRPDVIHFNDWQTGVATVYLKDVYGKFTFFNGIKSLYTIHNLQYQGVFGREVLGTIDLDDSYFAPDKMEFYDNINFMKAAIVYADAVSTVSETYASEIKYSNFGYMLNGVLQSRGDDVYGVINGIDVDHNNPETDSRIYAPYSKDDLSGKAKNKAELQKDLGLDVRPEVPIISIISRLADQKGLDLVALCMEELMGKDLQVVVLGTGEGRYEHLFKHYSWRFPNKMSANIFFSDELAQRIYAGSDMFLMPSLFEPCGLGQLFAMRYGTIPIARRTGGLNDTIEAYNPETGGGTGFLFNDYVASGMMWAINSALGLFWDNKEAWTKLIKNAMNKDYSWAASAKKYVELYKKLRDR